MKNILLTLLLFVPLAALADSDQTIMFELGIGFGGSGQVTKTKEQLANKFNNKFCYHRPQGRMIYGAIRYRYDDVETHIARWFNDTDTTKCDRDSWAVGLGYVLDTQDINANGVDYYATYTPGIAYTWGKNKNFNVQDNTNTNWRLKDKWQMYNRVAVGDGNKDWMGEVAVVRYGLHIVDYERNGENFLTITAGARDWDSEKPKNENNTNLTLIINDTRDTTTVTAPPAVAPTTPPADIPLGF